MSFTPQQIAWFKGAEMAVGGAVVGALLESPMADFHSKAGWVKFAGIVGASAYGALRLYMAQSPFQGVLVPQKPSEAPPEAPAKTEASPTAP